MALTDIEAQETLESFPAFHDLVDSENNFTKSNLEIMQVNVGKRCNLACKHCHIEAGPHRNELMTRQTMQYCLDIFVDYGFKILDITGGAPEMNPNFEWFITQAAKRNIAMTIRSNLVVLQNEQHRHLPELYAKLGVTIIASLPHYTKKASEKQRGNNTFDAVIAVLQQLNDLGYGKGKGLELNLVYNPGGAFLPPDQAALEKEYKQKLEEAYNITFDHLFAIANNPVGRFGNFLQKSNNLAGYMTRLTGAFNPDTLPTMMCRNQISVGWDGRIYDCDFNQAAELPAADELTIADLATKKISLRRKIAFGNHCYACCAGAGSSCGGATAE